MTEPRVQSYFLQFRARLLRLLAQNREEPIPNSSRLPGHGPASVPFKVGDRIRAKTTRYPVRAGAIGRVLEVKTFPLDGLVVEWDKPQENLAPSAFSILWPWDYEYYETLPALSE